jgi:hypothetical protein
MAGAPLRSESCAVIYRLILAARPVIEGRATIIAPVPYEPDLFRVRFEGEQQTCLRLVHGGAWQDSPDAVLNALTAHWRVSLKPELLKECPDGWRPRDPAAGLFGSNRSPQKGPLHE